jgi:transcriptional regulator with XRE-family HTH domain
MKKANTAARLKEIMDERNIKQVDILRAAKPFCEKYGVKLAKNDLSQYVNGKVDPGQEKLTILGLALNVSEAWLMGFDVSKDREAQKENPLSEEILTEGEKELLALFRQVPTEHQPAVLQMLRSSLTLLSSQ